MQMRRHEGGGAGRSGRLVCEDGFEIAFEFLQQHVHVKHIVTGDGVPRCCGLDFLCRQVYGRFGLVAECQGDDHMTMLGTLAALDAQHPHILPAMDLDKVVWVVVSAALDATKLGQQLQQQAVPLAVIVIT
jgi:hypothetical protein